MNFLNNLPPVTKNIIYINVIVFLLQNTIPGFTESLALHFFESPDFQPYQLLTHMFMHGDLSHLFFNMFGVFMFGAAVEQRMGSKRFFSYFLLTGFGAVILHFLSQYVASYELLLQIEEYIATSSPKISDVAKIFRGNFGITVGASGALFGLLVGFAMFFPNQKIFLIFLPIPIKAKYFVMIYAGYELFRGMANSPVDNIAHFAHLGGALFGFLIIRQWKNNGLV